MKRSTLPAHLLAQQIETNKSSYPAPTPYHFNLILIQSGKGQHVINNNRIRYEKGDVLFLRPLADYCMVADETTRFTLLSFTEPYIAELKAMNPNAQFRFNELNELQRHWLTGGIITEGKEQLRRLVDMLMAEQPNAYNVAVNPIIASFMTVIIGLLDRHLHQPSLPTNSTVETVSVLIQRIIAYVCQHIDNPEALRIEKIADTLHYSQSHLSGLFKQQVGESIQQYILRYKLRLVESRLCQSTMTVSQIADELGFTDVCHLNKLFKRYYQRTPTNYRREWLS